MFLFILVSFYKMLSVKNYYFKYFHSLFSPMFFLFGCFQALILASHGPDGHPSLGTSQNESAAIFFLELLIKVIIQNR